MTAMLEHTNFTVSDPQATANWMCDLFGWRIRWQGPAMSGGYTIHVGTDQQYLALYRPDSPTKSNENNYNTVGGLNHIAIVTDDLPGLKTAVERSGMQMGETYDYEPGKRFYFHDQDGIEYEVVQYA